MKKSYNRNGVELHAKYKKCTIALGDRIRETKDETLIELWEQHLRLGYDLNDRMLTLLENTRKRIGL